MRLPDVSFTMRTDRGVFSHGRLDAGTAVLLRAAPRAAGDGRRPRPRVRRRPDRADDGPACARPDVWAVDINERARTLCAANAAANGVTVSVVRAVRRAGRRALRRDLVEPADPHRQAGAPRPAADLAPPTDPGRLGRARRPEAPRRRLAAALARRRRATRPTASPPAAATASCTSTRVSDATRVRREGLARIPYSGGCGDQSLSTMTAWISATPRSRTAETVET